MQIISTIIAFILLYGSIICIHELGHLIVAKFFNVYCPRYAIGFGPVLFKKKFKETSYELRAIPLGGFVQMAGDYEDETLEDDIPKDRYLVNQPVYARIMIYLAGVFVNLLTAFLAMVVIFGLTDVIPTNSNKIGAINTNSVLLKTDIVVGDSIESIYVKDIDKTFTIASFQDINLTKETIGDFSNIHCVIQYNHNTKLKETEVTVPYNVDYGKYLLGIGESYRRPTIIEDLQYTTDKFVELALLILSTFGSLIVRFSETAKELSGPAGIYQVTSQITTTKDVSLYFYFWSMLCINIGVFNLLPIPGLDGYQVIITLIESITHKTISERIKEKLVYIGLSLILMLMIVATYYDITRLL